MAGDLERFLQEAAARLAEKVNQGQAKPQRAQRPDGQRPRAQPPIRQVERNRRVLEADSVDDAIVEAQLVDARTRRDSKPLARIDNRSSLSGGIDQADERMADHVHDALDHELGRLGQKPLERNRNPTLDEGRTDVMQRNYSISPLIDVLRKPDSLRAAFIVGEIFKRR